MDLPRTDLLFRKPFDWHKSADYANHFVMRICSLLPSATEIAFALGLGDNVVGVTHECDYPPEAKTKQVVVRSLIDPLTMSSSQIDHWVRDRLQTQQSLYTIDSTRFREAAPDVILTQELCEVCAVDYNEVVKASKLLPRKPKIVSLSPNSLTDVLQDIMRVGEATDRRTEATALVQQLTKRIACIRENVLAANLRPRVACLEWLDPLYFAGHWVPEMVELAGGEDRLGDKGKPSAKVEWNKLMEFGPEIIVLMPCGFDVDRTTRELHILEGLESWRELPAVKAGKVFAVNGHAYFSRSGPRLVDGLEILAQIFHPEIFSWQATSEAARRLA